MRLVINNLHPKGPCTARSWINDWPSHNHSRLRTPRFEHESSNGASRAARRLRCKFSYDDGFQRPHTRGGVGCDGLVACCRCSRLLGLVCFFGQPVLSAAVGMVGQPECGASDLRASGIFDRLARLSVGGWLEAQFPLRPDWIVRVYWCRFDDTVRGCASIALLHPPPHFRREINTTANKSMEPTGASRPGHFQAEARWRLAPAAHAQR